MSVLRGSKKIVIIEGYKHEVPGAHDGGGLFFWNFSPHIIKELLVGLTRFLSFLKYCYGHRCKIEGNKKHKDDHDIWFGTSI